MPINLLHFADLHLGVENYGRINPETGLNSRFEDFVRTLQHVVSAAINYPMDLVLFAGDAYKSRDPSPTHRRAFAREIRRLSAAGIPTVVLVGNHDVPNTRGRAHAIEVFQVLDVPDIHVVDVPRVLKIDTRHGPVQVMALPYRRPSFLMEKGSLRGRPQSEVAEEVVREYREWLEGHAEELDPTIPTVLAGHLHVAGAVASSERALMLSDEPAVSLSVLLRESLPLDYVALGHMHKHQEMNRGGYPPVVYSGSLERVDFGEEKEPKGYVHVRLARDATTYEFVPVDARRFVTVECKLEGDDPLAELERAVTAANVEGAVVRLRYTIPEDRRMLVSGGDLNRMLRRCHYVGRVEREVVRPNARQRDPHLTDSLDPAAALERYLQFQPPKSPVDDVLAAGRELILALQSEEP